MSGNLRPRHAVGLPRLHIALLPAALAALAASPPSAAADAGTDASPPAAKHAPAVSFDLGTGMQYDSNVAVLDLDRNANVADSGALVEFGTTYTKPTKRPVSIQAAYHFTDTLHRRFHAFDIGIHQASADFAHRFGGLDTGVMLDYAYATLHGAGFLTLKQISPYVSKLASKKLFLRFAYTRAEKDFATSPARNANRNSVSAGTYLLLNGLRSYLSFGARYEHESARAAEFTYSGYRLRTEFTRRISLASRRLTVKARLSYETRDYVGITPSIGAPRNDDRYQLEATTEVPLGKRLTGIFGFRHSDNRSNLPVVDFGENVFSVRFRARL